MEDLRVEEENRYIEEIRQSYARFGYIIAISPLLIYFDSFFPSKMGRLNTTFILFTIYALSHYFFIRRYPQRALIPRKILTIVIDIAATTFFIYTLDRYGFIFHVLYVWIIMGNGLRFGPYYLFFSMLLCVGAILAIYILNPFWKARAYIVVYMIATSIVVPLFALILMRRLREKNIELAKLLRLVERQSRIDSLTDIPNRLSFELELERYMKRRIPFALLFIDIDGFKAVNDNFGHDIGDEVLKEVAQRLDDSIEKGDFLARLGGDEFVVMSRGGEKIVRKLAEDICRRLSEPYGENAEIDYLSASIGISYFPKDTEDEFMLKRYADIAMYAVKQDGRNGYKEYCHCWKGRERKLSDKYRRNGDSNTKSRPSGSG